MVKSSLFGTLNTLVFFIALGTDILLAPWIATQNSKAQSEINYVLKILIWANQKSNQKVVDSGRNKVSTVEEARGSISRHNVTKGTKWLFLPIKFLTNGTNQTKSRPCLDWDVTTLSGNSQLIEGQKRGLDCCIYIFTLGWWSWLSKDAKYAFNTLNRDLSLENNLFISLFLKLGFNTVGSHHRPANQPDRGDKLVMSIHDISIFPLMGGGSNIKICKNSNSVEDFIPSKKLNIWKRMTRPRKQPQIIPSGCWKRHTIRSSRTFQNMDLEKVFSSGFLSCSCGNACKGQISFRKLE